MVKNAYGTSRHPRVAGADQRRHATARIRPAVLPGQFAVCPGSDPLGRQNQSTTSCGLLTNPAYNSYVRWIASMILQMSHSSVSMQCEPARCPQSGHE